MPNYAVLPLFMLTFPLGELSFKAVLCGADGNCSGILAAEAGVAVIRRSDHFRQILQGQIPQAVRADDGSDFLHRMVAGNEVVPGINIRSVVAGVAERGRGNAHVDFPGACLPEQSHDLPAGSAPDNGVVNQDDPLPLHLIPDGAELDFYLADPLTLTGGNEGSSDVFILNETYFREKKFENLFQKKVFVSDMIFIYLLKIF